ncbi:MAG: radical SAM protein, partial [Desulfovibrio sp.]|nr:radical SAM protein [Desulfovibrio sp.]
MCHRPLPVWCVSLGCPKNRVDTERALGSLGFPAKLVATPGKSKLAFINTCAFIEPAVRESIREIIDLVKTCSKLKSPPLIAVAGCLPGRYGVEELAREFPEVGLWLEPASQAKWPSMIAQCLNRETNGPDGRLTPAGASYAWLKICDGCDHKCSFCAIPSIRGKFQSERRESLLSEARELVSRGVKELILVGQDITAWGKDLGPGEGDLISLLGELAGLEGLRWLRALYLYPGAVTKNFVKSIS